jgi:hypothetical protein
MPITYNTPHNLFLYSPAGQFLTSLRNAEKIDCALAENGIGVIEVTLPLSGDDSVFVRDARIAYTRQRLVGGTPFLLARARKQAQDDGTWQRIVTALHPNCLLDRRVVAYNEGTSQASKTGTADDVMKAIVRENFTAATDTTRNWSSSFFTVEADASASSVAVSIECSYRNVLQTLQEICAQAAAQGEYLGFEVTSLTEGGAFVFRTYVGQRGVDHSSTSDQPLIISSNYGSLGAVELDEDWTTMASFIYAGGQGALDERIVATDSDAALIALSPYGRTEFFASQSQTEQSVMLDGVAARRLHEMRPRRVFTGTVIDTDAATFGEEYDWGDIVVGEFSVLAVSNTGGSGVLYNRADCRVNPVHISVSRVVDPETGFVVYDDTLDIHLRSIDS